MNPIIILSIIAAAAVGAVIGYLLRKQIAAANANSVEAIADKLLTQAKTKQQQILIDGKDKAMKLLDETKKEDEERRRESRKTQDRLEKRENMFDQKLLEFQDRQDKLKDQIELVKSKAKEVETIREQEIQKLEGISRLSQKEAKEELYVLVEKNSKEDLLARTMKLEHDTSEEMDRRANRILSTVMERYAASCVSENATTVVDIPNEEMKGRIIGKEGRNIRTIERMTGCELIIDETPGVVTISSYSPIRRQVARLSLEKLVKDGRIHPARVESFVEESKKELALDIKKAGEEVLYELGITSVDPKLVSILGRLKYRTSYGQNQLNHAKEVAYMCAMLAKELGADVKAAKIAGLFHDIGKAVDHETQGGHPEIGFTIMKKFNYPEEIAYCCIAHHEDKPTTLLGSISKVADALSGARPGARRDSHEQYIQRLEDLENIALRHEGVDKAFAIQAGREIRVFIDPKKLDDYGSYNLAKQIANEISAEMQYPGEIRVVAIRETRVIEYAK